MARTTPTRKVDVTAEGAGWTWNLFAANGTCLAKAGQTFSRRADAVKAARRALNEDVPVQLRQFERDELLHSLSAL